MAPGHDTPRARRAGCSSGVGPQSASFWRRVRRALVPRRFAGNPRRSLFGAGPSQNGTCFGGGIGRKSRAGRSAVNYFRFGRTRVCIAPISLHREKIISGDKISTPLRWQKIDLFSGLGEERRTPRATSRPLDHGRIHLISSRPSSTFTVALPDTKWAGGGLILGRSRPIVA